MNPERSAFENTNRAFNPVNLRTALLSQVGVKTYSKNLLLI